MSTFGENVSFANNKINFLICPLKCEGEHTLINSLETSVEKVFSFFRSECLPLSETPDEMYFYACSYLLGSRIRVFKMDPNGNVCVLFNKLYGGYR